MSSLAYEQDQAVTKINKWVKDKTNKKPFILKGPAGTGKTFLLAHLIKHYSGRIHCCAPTGKACSVLQIKLKGIISVVTLHKLLYTPVEKAYKEIRKLEQHVLNHPEDLQSKEALRRAKKEVKDDDIGFIFKDDHGIIPGSLIIVDEASMVALSIKKDLERLDAKILFVGDSFQLPPINSKNWFLSAKPDYELTEVHRQALDNPIINLSMLIRTKGKIPKGDHFNGDQGFSVKTKKEIANEQWLDCDQILTGSNFSRQRINRFYRKRLGFESHLPVKNDKVICLKNLSTDSYQLINGVQGIIQKDVAYNQFSTDFPKMNVLYEDSLTLNNLSFYPYHFLYHYNQNIDKEPFFMLRGISEWDYAYAITVHKSQGSEWDKVIIADDKMRAHEKLFRRKWLYTAVTRASKQLIWVQ